MAASLLLLLEEDDAFWMMATIVEDLLPASYYSSTLLGKYILCCGVTKHLRSQKFILSMLNFNYFHRYSS